MADDWRGFDAALAAAGPRPRPVLSFDHRGLGRSGGTAPTSTHNMATDVLGLVAKVLAPIIVQRAPPVLPQARHVHVLGASMGGPSLSNLLCVCFQAASACVAVCGCVVVWLSGCVVLRLYCCLPHTSCVVACSCGCGFGCGCECECERVWDLRPCGMRICPRA